MALEATMTQSSRYWHPRRVDTGAKSEAVRKVLSLARQNLDMDVGYFGTFADGAETYQVVDRGPDAADVGPTEGGETPVEQTLCWQVVTGRMGPTVADTTCSSTTRDLRPVTQESVGSYVGVPVHEGQELLGMLCLVSRRPRPELGPHEVDKMRLFAQVVALELGDRTRQDPSESRHLEALHRLLVPGSELLTVVFQPVASIASRLRDGSLDVSSVEALSRISGDPAWTVEDWFDLAWRHGLGPDLEMAAIDRAFAALPDLPEPVRLAVNASPDTITSERFRASIPAAEAHRITLELTEHVLEDDGSLRPGLDLVRATGVALAIDDLGTGSSNLQRVIELAPEVIKVDLSITDGVEWDPLRRALVSALVGFARDVGIKLVTEGVERTATAYELDRLGVGLGQGWWLSRAISADQLAGLRAA